MFSTVELAQNPLPAGSAHGTGLLRIPISHSIFSATCGLVGINQPASKSVLNDFRQTARLLATTGQAVNSRFHRDGRKWIAEAARDHANVQPAKNFCFVALVSHPSHISVKPASWIFRFNEPAYSGEPLPKTFTTKFVPGFSTSAPPRLSSHVFVRRDLPTMPIVAGLVAATGISPALDLGPFCFEERALLITRIFHREPR